MTNGSDVFGVFLHSYANSLFYMMHRMFFLYHIKEQGLLGCLWRFSVIQVIVVLYFCVEVHLPTPTERFGWVVK